MAEFQPQPQRQPVRPLTRVQKGCLIGCLVGALLLAGAILGTGFWLRGLLQEHPESSARLFFPQARSAQVMVQPGGIGHLLTSDLMLGFFSAWSLDGETVAVCAMPRMDLRKFMFVPPTQEWDPRKIQKQQQAKVMAALAPRLYLIEVKSGETRELRPPGPGEHMPQDAAWLPDGRLVVCTYPFEAAESPLASPESPETRIWLVDPAEDTWEELGRFKHWTRVGGTRHGAVLSTHTETEGDLDRILVAGEKKPRLREVARGWFSYCKWADDGNLYQWGTVEKEEPAGLWRFSLRGDEAQRIAVHPQEGRSSDPISDAEMLIQTGFGKGAKQGQAVFAVELATGRMRRLSEKLTARSTQLLGSFFKGRWVLLGQRLRPEDKRRLTALCLANGRIYPLLEEGVFEILISSWQVLSPTGNTLVLQKEVGPADVFKMFTGGFGSELWLLQLDEEQLLQQEPVKSHPPED